MVTVKRIVLDVLKPHHPNALDFAKVIAGQGPGYRVTINVTEVDERTESTVLTVEGDAIDFECIAQAISSLGGSVHSIDEVEAIGEPDETQ